MSQLQEVIHFTLEGKDLERFFNALRIQNSESNSPMSKNQYAKLLLTESMKRRDEI